MCTNILALVCEIADDSLLMLQLAGLAVNRKCFTHTARLDDRFMRLNSQQSDKLQHKDKMYRLMLKYLDNDLYQIQKNTCASFFSSKPLQDIARYTDHADVLAANLPDEIHRNYKRAILLVLPPEL